MNKKFKILSFGIIFLLISTACLAASGGSNSNTNSGKTEQKNESSTPTQVEQQNTSSNSGQSFKPYSGKMPSPGGLITAVTLAKSTKGANFEPVDPSTAFDSNATIHAVVTIKKAPNGTNFSAKWLTTDVGDADKPDKVIDKTETTTDGSRNIDFSLSPTTTFPEGNYRVEIYVNGKLDQLKEFSIVAGGSGGDTNTSSSTSTYIESVTLAKGVKGTDKEPVNPTAVFGQKDTVHAVTKFKDAPDGTNFTANWLVTDIGDVAAPDTVVDTFSVKAGGNGTIDFTLVPSKPLPKGTYRVEILVNEQNAWKEPFEVK